MLLFVFFTITYWLNKFLARAMFLNEVFYSNVHVYGIRYTFTVYGIWFSSNVYRRRQSWSLWSISFIKLQWFYLYSHSVSSHIRLKKRSQQSKTGQFLYWYYDSSPESGSRLHRDSPSNYHDGVYMLDSSLPSARAISDLVFKGESGIPNKRNMTTMLAFFSRLISRGF